MNQTEAKAVMDLVSEVQKLKNERVAVENSLLRASRIFISHAKRIDVLERKVRLGKPILDPDDFEPILNPKR